MEKNKATLYVIIVLLIICLPCSIIGIITHFNDTNIKRNFKFNGSLYFYEEKKLLGTYKCQNENCDYAKDINNHKTSAIRKKIAFIKDGKKIIAYDFVNSKKIDEYEAIKTLNNFTYAVSKNSKWGVAQILNELNIVAEIKYNDVNILNSYFIAKEDNFTKVLSKEKELFQTDKTIIDLNDKYIILQLENNMIVCDYENNFYFNDIDNKEVSFLENYFLIKRSNNYFVFQIVDNETKNLGSFTYDGTEVITAKENDNNIEIYAGNDLQKTIELNS